MIDPNDTESDEVVIPFDEWGEVRNPKDIEEDGEPSSSDECIN